MNMVFYISLCKLWAFVRHSTSKGKVFKKQQLLRADACYTHQVRSSQNLRPGWQRKEGEMGCQNAKSSQKEDCEDEKELGDFLTVEEIEVIRHTWAIVKQDIPGTGMFMFTR